MVTVGFPLMFGDTPMAGAKMPMVAIPVANMEDAVNAEVALDDIRPPNTAKRVATLEMKSTRTNRPNSNERNISRNSWSHAS